MRTVLILVLAALVAACGAGEDGGSGASEGPHLVVTTTILGDIVGNLVGDDAEVEVIMPPGTDPHEFSPSAKQATALRSADLVIANGLGFEAGMQDTLDAAADDGVEVVEVAELAPDHLTASGEAHEEGAGDAGAHGHDHEGEDPHVFTDPARMAVAAAALADRLGADVDGLDTPAFRERAAGYVAELEALDEEVEALLAPIPPARRLLVTNHEVLGYFADRYGFEVLGTVIPSLSTLAEPSAADLADLADLIERAGVPAIFAESSSSTRLAEALAAEGADVQVVELFGESLGERGSGGETYVEMLRTNARRIAAALGA